jgi:uncharacterized protein YicC (UPF0701 family)
VSWHPDVSGSRPGVDLSPYQVRAAVRSQRKAELQVFRHGLRARMRAERDRIDSQAAADAMRTALEEELDLLDYGLQQARGSLAKAELVARKVELLASLNNSRITRRFGG